MAGSHLADNSDLTPFLAPTFFLDFQAESVCDFAIAKAGDKASPVERAVRLFYAVRDDIAYDMLSDRDLSAERFCASDVLARGRGFCVPKAVLLAAVSRWHGIPSRLCFADVRNHLTTPKMRELMGTDVFTYHGYVELLLGEKWIKTTPAFDRGMCERHGVRPIEWDGTHDAIFHEFDTRERKHMVYVQDRGRFADLPHEQLATAIRAAYPRFFHSDPLTSENL